MTKTVQQLINDYKNRSTKANLGFVMFLKNGRPDGYSMVANLYRDGIEVKTLDLDETEHKYEFDSGYRESYFNDDIEWNHHVFIAQIIEYGQKIKE